MLGQTPRHWLIGSLALALVLLGVLAACGAQSSVSVVGADPRQTIRPTPVAQITVPPDRAQVPLVVSPTSSPTRLVPLTRVAEEGRRIVAERGCRACHGKDLEGGIGPPLSGRSPRELTDYQIRQQLRNIYYGLSDQEVLSVIAFIRSQA